MCPRRNGVCSQARGFHWRGCDGACTRTGRQAGYAPRRTGGRRGSDEPQCATWTKARERPAIGLQPASRENRYRQTRAEERRSPPEGNAPAGNREKDPARKKPRIQGGAVEKTLTAGRLEPSNSQTVKLGLDSAGALCRSLQGPWGSRRCRGPCSPLLHERHRALRFSYRAECRRVRRARECRARRRYHEICHDCRDRSPFVISVGTR